MKQRIIDKWNSIDARKRLWVTLFIQIWVWPQFFQLGLPVNLGVPLAITAAAVFVYNFILLVVAIDKHESDNYWNNRRK